MMKKIKEYSCDDMPQPFFPSQLWRFNDDNERTGIYHLDEFVSTPFYISQIAEVENSEGYQWSFFLNVLSPENIWDGDWVSLHHLHYNNHQKMMDKMMDMGVWMEGSVALIKNILNHHMRIILKKEFDESN